MDTETAEFTPQEKARLRITEAKKQAENILAAQLKSRGLTAHPICHMWLADDLFTVAIRQGPPPPDDERPEYLRGIDLAMMTAPLAGTVRAKRELDGVYTRPVYSLVDVEGDGVGLNRHARRKLIKEFRKQRRK